MTRLIRLDQTSSTNQHLKGLVLKGRVTDPYTACISTNQTAGLGRAGRSWSCPPGQSLAFSLYVKPDQLFEYLGSIPLITGLGVLTVVKKYGIDGGIKWPNDILVGGKKLAGVLCELLPNNQGLIIGVGLNLRGEILPVSISLETAGAKADRIRAQELSLELIEQIRFRLEPLAHQGVQGTISELRRCCLTLNRRVRVTFPNREPLIGQAVGLASTGQLQVQDDSGGIHSLLAADIEHLRAE